MALILFIFGYIYSKAICTINHLNTHIIIIISELKLILIFSGGIDLEM